MIFALDRKEIWKEKQSGRQGKAYSGENTREPQCAQVSDLCKQRLLGYAESFRELARSFYGECPMTGEDRQSVIEERKLWENRQVISHNLNEVAQIMTQIADQELCYQPMEERRRKVLVHALRAEGIVADDICYLPNEKGLLTIGMTMSTEKKGGMAVEEAADMLSVLLRNKLQPSATNPYRIDRTSQSFVFVEEARYIALTGFAKVTKENETVSGDNYSIMESERGRMTVLLSDGTGSGEQACADSERVLDLMEKMLETGFSIETAVDMVNAAVFARGEESNHPTLDICNLDLYQGTCDICKVGGATTFLKREQEVEEITMGSLPLGIFQKVQTQTQHKELEDGDYLILMTDGVLDALEDNDGEALMAETIRGLTERNPKEMAEKLLQLVLCYCGGHIRDDMTILVVGIWEN